MPRGRRRAIDPKILKAALSGLEAQRERLDEQITQVRGMLGRRGVGRFVRRVTPTLGRTAAVQDSAKPKRRRTMSAVACRRISLAQKKRWAEAREEGEAEVKAQK